MAKHMPLYNVLLLGAKGVGKTALLHKIVLGYFVGTYDPTLEDCYRKQVLVDGERALLEFLNTGGIETYPAARLQYLKACNCAIIVYSVCSRSSFEQVSAIHKEILGVREGDMSFPISLVGNKIDSTDQREVSFEEGRKLAGRLGCAFEECSAKDGTNVEKATFDLVRALGRRRAEEKILHEQRRRMEDDERNDKEARGETTMSSFWRKLFCH